MNRLVLKTMLQANLMALPAIVALYILATMAGVRHPLYAIFGGFAVANIFNFFLLSIVYARDW